MADASRRLLVAYVPVLAAATTMIAADRGYFKDAGLDVELITIATAQDAIALLARRRLDAAVGGISAAFFNAVRRGFNVRLAGCVCYMPKTGHPTALMIRTDKYEGGILIPQQLRGEKIGVIGGLGTASSYYVGEMIRPLTFADVDLVPLNSADQGIALARKSIAAALVWNPFTQAYERKNIAKVAALPTPARGRAVCSTANASWKTARSPMHSSTPTTARRLRSRVRTTTIRKTSRFTASTSARRNPSS
jgi:ABC-type nitrate/sulfonate/bicarbonate transport system substrate-binding protein